MDWMPQESDLILLDFQDQFCAGSWGDKWLQLSEKQCLRDCLVREPVRAKSGLKTTLLILKKNKKKRQTYLTISETKSALRCLWIWTLHHGTGHTQWSHCFCDRISINQIKPIPPALVTSHQIDAVKKHEYLHGVKLKQKHIPNSNYKLHQTIHQTS